MSPSVVASQYPGPANALTCTSSVRPGRFTVTVPFAGPLRAGTKFTTRWQLVPADAVHRGVTDHRPLSPDTVALARNEPLPSRTVRVALLG